MPPGGGRGNGWLTGADRIAVEPSEGDLIEGLCVPIFRRLATFSPSRSADLRSRHAWDDPTDTGPLRRSSRDADVSIADPNAVSDRRSVAPDAIDTMDRSACCSAHRNGVQPDRPKRQPPSLDASPARRLRWKRRCVRDCVLLNPPQGLSGTQKITT